MGGLAGALTGSPNVALGGYSAGSTIGKNICESNKNYPIDIRFLWI
jgi:hypothetical protein